MHAFGRYDFWRPDAGLVIAVDGDDTLIYPVDHIDQLTLGLNYVINDYFRVKLEYSDSLGSKSSEPDFEHRLGSAQFVVVF